MRTTRSHLVLAGVVLGLLASAPLAYAQPYDNYIWQFPRVTNISSTADGMKTTLQEEVQKILDAGHLAPLRIHYADIVSEGYFLYHERGRIIATLAWAYPYLTSTQQSAVRTYVGTELSTAAYTPWSTSPRNIPQDQGARRELYTPQQVWGWTIFWNNESGHTKPVIHNLYGLWLYAYRSGDWAAISTNWNTIKSYYTANSGEGNIYGTIGAHVAMARMAQYMNDTAARDTAITNATTAFNDGKTFSTIETRCQNTYYAYFYESRKAGLIYRGTMFLNLSPEVGRYLKDYVSSTVLSRTDQGKSMFPKWWLIQAPYFCRWTGDEGIGIPSEMAGMIFPVERWVRQASADTLAGWMVSAPDGKGDCYWMENLVQAIEAYGTLTWTDVRGGGDTTAPSAVSNLSAPSSTANSVTLNWTAPGDDGSTGTASTYDIRRSTSTITDANWGSATQVSGEPTPAASGTGQSMTVSGLSASTTYYFAMKTADEVPNTSGLSNVVSKATTASSDTTAPSAVSNLSAPSSTSGSVTLNWTATGDDGATGTASSYDIRRSTSTITDANWASATSATGEPTPKASGQAETFTVNGLNASTTYYFAMKVMDEVPNTSGLSNVVSKATIAGGGSNLLTQGDFQAGTAFTNATYTAGTSSDGVWYAGTWTNTANAGDAGTGDYAAKVNNNYSDLRLFQGVAAPANGTSMTLSFKYIRPSGMASYVRVYGLTSGQLIQPWAAGTLQGTQLFTYDLTNQSSWASVNNQTFTVSGTFAKLVVFISLAGDATACVDDFVLSSGSGGGDTTAPTAVNNLSAPSSTATSVTLNWTATGDDGSTGTASTYDIRRSTATITEANWASATAVTGEPTPAVSGTAQSMTVSGLTASTTYYFAMKVADEVPNTSALSNVVSKATAAIVTNLLTDGDLQSATAFTTGSYTAGTSSDGVWYSSTRWVKTADAGEGGTGDTAATLTNNWSDLRLFQGAAAPANGTGMSLSFKYVQPGSGTCVIQVYGLTSGQVISNSAGGTLQGTQLFTYSLSTASSWTSVSSQSFTVSGTYAKLVVYISVGADAGIKVDDVVLTQP